MGLGDGGGGCFCHGGWFIVYDPFFVAMDVGTQFKWFAQLEGTEEEKKGPAPRVFFLEGYIRGRVRVRQSRKERKKIE